MSRPPSLEDFLNGTPREAEARVADFRQHSPGDGVPASQETTAYLSYDDKNLYVVFVCKNEPGKTRARWTKREQISADDVVGVLLDTFNDRRRGYIFDSNPLGIQRDAVLTEGQNFDMSYDTLWHSEGRVTGEGFILWIALPFKSLRFTNAPKQTWGIALVRFIPRNSEVSFWPYITQRLESILQQVATLEGLQQISPGRNLQFIPYGVFSRSRFLDTQVPGFRTQNDARAGLDAKIVLRDAFTLDVALNPDFSQVESDEPQVTINQRFEVFFPEKRPFFIENAGFFQTPENLFFSRRIVDPQFGARLTGKTGRWAIGGLAIDDEAPGKRVPPTDPLHGQRAGIGMARVQREFAAQSTIGLLVTSRDLASSWNRVFSLDTRLRLHPNWSLSGQFIRTTTRELDGTRLSGPASYAQLNHSGRHFFYTGSYSDRSPAFRSELGFIPRVDIRQFQNFLNYLWRPKDKRVLNFGPTVSTLVNWDRQGRLQDWAADAGFTLGFAGLTHLFVRRNEAFELFENRGFRKHTTSVFFFSERLPWLTIFANYNQGAGINFFPAGELPPFRANSVDGYLGLTLRPTTRFRIDQTYLYSRLGTRPDSAPPGTPLGASIFNNHLLRSKLNYQFNRELSLRAILDYNAVLPNTSLVSLERTKRFTADFLLTYLLNPGTAFYVGYTDGYENLALLPTLPPTLGRTISPATSTGRNFFVKMSYLFRY